MMGNALRLIVGCAIALLFLWLILRRVEPNAVAQAVAGANLGWLIAACVALAFGYMCRIERWRLLLAPANPALRWALCAGPLLASFAANNVLPFRAGDVIRSFAFNERLGAGPGAVAATVFAERLLDLLIILSILGGALVLFGTDAAGVAGVSGIALLVLALVVLLVLAYPNLVSPLARMLGNCLRRWSPRFGQKIASEIDNSLVTLVHLASSRRLIVLLLWSAAVWLAEGCVFWMVALSFKSILQPLAGWLALPVATLATLVPSTPGYVGTFDYFALRAMTLVGNDETGAVAYVLLVHALIWVLPTTAGGVYLLVSPIRTREAKALAS